jgi:hypothetical protein
MANFRVLEFNVHGRVPVENAGTESARVNALRSELRDWRQTRAEFTTAFLPPAGVASYYLAATNPHSNAFVFPGMISVLAAGLFGTIALGANDAVKKIKAALDSRQVQ